MTIGQAKIWNVGAAYEDYVGRWSRLVAADFLGWLGTPSGRRWLDVGCGTGELSRSILERAAPESLVGIDPSAGFVAHARAALPDPRVEFRNGYAQALPFPDRDFDAVVSGLAVNFFSDMPKALAEMVRVARPGATVAAYVWDYADGMQMMRRFWDAAIALDGATADQDEGRRFAVCRPEPLAALFKGAGLANVETRAIDCQTAFRDFDDFWNPFLAGQGPAPAFCMSLSECDRNVLREKVRAALPIRKDGSIHLMARAFAVRGVA